MFQAQSDVFGFPFVPNQMVTRSAAIQGFSNALKPFNSLTFVEPSAMELQNVGRVEIARMDSPIGKFVAFEAHKDSEVKVHSIDAGTINEVPRGVFHSVLTGAQMVDFTAVTKFGKDTYFFTKPFIWQSSEDVKALHRLGPRINLTTHETQSDDGMTMEVKVHLDDTVLLIKYGADPEEEKTHLIRHASKVMSRKMWLREKEILMLNRKNRGVVEPLSHDWSKQQKEQLLNQGLVEGYELQYKVDPQKFPALSYDLNNFRFIKKSSP